MNWKRCLEHGCFYRIEDGILHTMPMSDTGKGFEEDQGPVEFDSFENDEEVIDFLQVVSKVLGIPIVATEQPKDDNPFYQINLTNSKTMLY